MVTARFQVVSLPRSVPAYSSVSGKRSATQVEAAPSQSRRFTWRFLAANNRSLAMATEVFPDAISCIAALHQLKRGLAEAACELSRDEDGLWRWTVRLGDVIATSSHRYPRQVRAKITCDTFFALADDPAALHNIQVVYR